MLRIRHALIEVSNQPITKKSAIIINNEIIIASGCLLQAYVRPILPFLTNENNENICASTKIIHKLQNCQLIDAQDEGSDEANLLNSLNYQVTFDRRKLPPTSHNRQQSHILTRYRAKLLYLFSSAEIARHLHNLLIQSVNPDSEHNEALLSSFMVLTFRPAKEKETFERFLNHIINYVRYLPSISTLDDVLTMCSPFGMENFYRTISIGKVSNVMGRDCSMFVMSNALPLGCEGSAVFNNKLHLIGIIICTSFQRHQENVNLTLAANFSNLLCDLMKQLGIPVTSKMLAREPSNFPWERSMVVIEAGDSQGTGTFVRVQNKKFILTCSHVVNKIDSKVYCRSANGEFESDIVWRNPEYDKPFDVAVLAAPTYIPSRYFVRLSSAKPSLGQTVYNAGFPYFVNFHLKYDFNPSIFEGRIIKCTRGAIMSDGCVQAGQSGGPMFDEQGCILGICVSNIKMNEIVYPNINTAVPISEIRSTLIRYAKTDDVAVLNNLVANQEIQRTWSLETPYILSKL